MGGRLNPDPKKPRYGCFVPDLTGLARIPVQSQPSEALYGE